MTGLRSGPFGQCLFLPGNLGPQRSTAPEARKRPLPLFDELAQLGEPDRVSPAHPARQAPGTAASSASSRPIPRLEGSPREAQRRCRTSRIECR